MSMAAHAAEAGLLRCAAAEADDPAVGAEVVDPAFGPDFSPFLGFLERGGAMVGRGDPNTKLPQQLATCGGSNNDF